MADQTPIEWTDATWNIITGCSVVSPGCTNCYAMKLAGTRLQHHPSRAGLTTASKAGAASSSAKRDRPTKHVWNGQVRFNAEWLTHPLRRTKPRMIFVCAHGDLFHEGVPDDWLDQIFAVMALCPQHTFQVLTKRPERMRAYITGQDSEGLSARERIDELVRDWLDDHSNRTIRRSGRIDVLNDGYAACERWPLPNVWLGVSVEDQTRADERIPVLLDTPAAVRWISAEPLLGPVDLRGLSTMRWRGAEVLNALTGELSGMFGDFCARRAPRIDWVVAGGESGPGARPMHPDWARQLRDQCAEAGVPFLFKQWGSWAPVCALTEEQICDLYHPRPARDPEGARRCKVAKHTLQRDGSRHHFAEPGAWQQGTGPMLMLEAGKKAAGRHLDGQLHDGFPEVQ